MHLKTTKIIQTAADDGARAFFASSIQQITDYRLQVGPTAGGARNGAKLGSMGIYLMTKLINIVIIIRRKCINLVLNQT